MNISLIASLSRKNVYFVKDSTMSYYLSIPKKNSSNIHITIEIKNNLDKYDFTKNDTLWVKENVIAYYKELDNTPDSYVIPMFNQNALNIVGDTDTNNYIHIEKLITYIINNVYTLLSNNKITPLKQVILIKNEEFLSFINYFNNKYGSRIITKTLLELLQENNISYDNYKKIETDDMNFVVGRNTEQFTVVADDVKKGHTVPETMPIVNRKPVPVSSGGYISYYLLGAAAIIFSIFILYLLI